MRRFIKRLAGALALSMLVTATAPAGMAAVAGSNLQIAYQNGSAISEINLANIGDTEDLKFLNAPSNWKTLGATWTSSNSAVATVDESGIVTAVGAGSAIISIAVGEEKTSIVVNVVNMNTYTATIGVGTDRDMSSVGKKLKVDESFDFAFYGIKDYDKDRYFCTWATDDPTVLEIDQKGLVTAIKPGTSKVTLVVFNKITGQVHRVNPVLVTVEEEVTATATPTPTPTEAPEEEEELSMELKQTTEMALEVKFTGVDVTKLTKNDIEIYEYYENEDYTQEYIWQIHTVSANEETNTLTVNGYTTDELKDGCIYVVRYVERDGDKVTVLAEEDFVASVGEVADVETWYASYLNNQGGWQFKNKAYTNASSGEEIDVKVFYNLYDANGVDVTGHYERLVGGDLITLQLVNEDLDSYVILDEEKNQMVFTDIPETPVVKFEAVYDDFETGNTVTDTVLMVVEKAVPYEVVSIDDWAITLNDNNHKGRAYKKTEIALHDDYDLLTETELMNHEVVLWFTDNYGNKFVTNSVFAGGAHKDITTSEKFSGEGFELRYESRNPQVLVVGDEDDGITGAVNSSIITTKATGVASVNVTLYNTFEEELVERIGVLKVTVKPERYIQTVKADSISVTTDSKSEGAQFSYVSKDNKDGDDYDTRFTQGSVEITVLDQYGEPWGLYNDSVLEHGIDITAVATGIDTVDGWSRTGAYTYVHTFDGVDLYDKAGKVSSVSYKVTVADKLHDKEKTTNFRVSLKYPTEIDSTHEIQCKTKLKLSTFNASYAGTSYFRTPIKVEEISTNGYAVNYADGITLIDTKEKYNAYFGTNKTASASEGALFLVVYNPKNEIVETVSGSAIGIRENESGLYDFQFADGHDGNRCTEFAMAGNYTVKLIEVTSVKNNGTVNTFTTTVSRFALTDDRMKISLKNQEAIYVSNATWYAEQGICGIAQNAFSYSTTIANWNWANSVAGVRFKANNRAKSVVVQDAFVKVFIDVNRNGAMDDNAFYYVEVPVDKTVSLEDMSIVDTDTTIKNGYDPDGNKMQ